jgi:hypothetical protein
MTSPSGFTPGVVAGSVPTAITRLAAVMWRVPAGVRMPPTQRRFSTTAARLPSLAAWIAERWPAGPLPIATRSKS